MALAGAGWPERVTYADVAIVGAGPGGSTAAAYLARAGRDVALIEKETFPRVKVCGDGLTPRAVRELQELGLFEEAEGRVPGWQRNDGLKLYGGGHILELPWPQLNDWPAHGLTCSRVDFDATLARHAVKQGAQLLEGTEVTGPLVRGDAPGGRVTGVRWRDRAGREGEVRAPVVIASDGASSRFAISLGLTRRADRPLGVAVRTYYRSPMARDRWLSAFLELQQDNELLPGYGWLFPMADGTVNLGCGLMTTSRHFRRCNPRTLMHRWAAAMPPEWELAADHQRDRVLSGALPMGFSRLPHHHRGVLLVGDAGGMVNPFNGEGISYAMEAARVAAEATDRALAARTTRVLDGYATEMRRRLGGYYTLGRVFTKVISLPSGMRRCTAYGMNHPTLMVFVFKLMAQLTDEPPSDAMDAVINTLQRVAPAA